jgi:hypothetical protein
LESLLEVSAATPEFKHAVSRMQKGEAPGPAISAGPGAPPVKVLRVVSKLLETEPRRPIASVRIDALSGCSDFTGQLSVNDGELVIRFKWDCAWRAEQQGLVDYFGSPDQIRAAQSFGYQCFEEWSVIQSTAKN